MSVELWKELIGESLDSHGVTATAEQIALIAEDAAGIAESISEYSFRPADPMIRELADTEAALKREREKVTCRTCTGTGYLISHGPHHSSESSCWKCRGEGRHTP